MLFPVLLAAVTAVVPVVVAVVGAVAAAEAIGGRREDILFLVPSPVWLVFSFISMGSPESSSS